MDIVIGGTGTTRPINLYTSGNRNQLVLVTDGSVSMGGTLAVTGNITGPNVSSGADPGHTHTGASLSGIDISADTNLAATAPIIMTDDTMSLDYDATDFSVVGTTLTITDSGIDHDATTNFVALEHVDHSGVSISPGVGLSGGGTLEATRTLALDIHGLTGASPAVAVDEFPFWDETAGTARKITFTNLNSSLVAESLSTNLTAGSVVFSNGTNLSQDNTNFFWDSANVRLGIGSSGPTYTFYAKQAAVGRIAGFYATDVSSIGDEALIHIGGANLASHYGIEIGSAPEEGAPAAQKHAFIVKLNKGTGTDHVERFRVSSSGEIGPWVDTASPGTITNITGALIVGRFRGTGRVTGTVTGFNSKAVINSGAATGTTTNLKGGNYTVENNDADTVVTYAYGLTINNPTNAGTITNTRGLWIGSQTVGTQTNTPYGIYQDGASDYNYFAGKVGILDATPTAALDVNSDIIRLRTAKTPASSGAAGNQGDICWDADYIYVCTATNTWERAAIATWV